MRKVIYTVGHETSYDEGLARYGRRFRKLGRTATYSGGFALRTIEDAERLIHEKNKHGEWAVYEVSADWHKHTVPSEHGWWHALVVSSRIIRKIK